MNQSTVAVPQTLKEAKRLCDEASYYSDQYQQALEDGSEDARQEAGRLAEQMQKRQAAIEKSPFRSRLIIDVDKTTMHVFYSMKP